MRAVWHWWRRVGKSIGDAQARLFLALFYFLVLAPFALAVRWWSDPLAIKTLMPEGWRLKEVKKGSPMERALAQS